MFDGECLQICHGSKRFEHQYHYNEQVYLVRTQHFDEVFAMFLAHDEKTSCLTGPTGIGKTESYKDYHKYLGHMLVVVNCNDQMT